MPKLPLSKTTCCWCGSQGLTVYSFPSAKYHDIYEKWIAALCEHNVVVSSSPEEVRQNLRICERHFHEDDFFYTFKRNKTRRKLLKHNSVPFPNVVPVYVSVNDQITNRETNHRENERIDDASGNETLNFGDEVENICIPVACTDFVPSSNVEGTPTLGIPDANKLYKLCLRQQETIGKQRKIIEDLEVRLKLLENEPRVEDDLNNEFVVHQRQKKRKPRGRRYTDEMKLFGVEMLKQGTVTNYEKWRKLFVMPSRRTLDRVAKTKMPLQTDTNERLLQNLQMPAVNETSRNKCLSKPPSELTSTPQD